MPQTNNLDPHHWVTAYADYLYAFAIRRINNEEQAKDLVQETFLAALEKRNTFRGESSERTWLTAILKNKIVDVYRKRSSGLRKEVTEAEHVQQDFFEADGHWRAEHRPLDFGLNHTDLLVNKELNAIIQMCIKKMPALWMAVFTMKHIDDEETEFVCAELKVSPSNFWVIMHRAKLNLRACLQKNWI